VLVYSGAGTPGQPFTMEGGHRVAAGTRAAGEARVRTLTPFRCAASVYCGGVSNLGKAIAEVSKAMQAKGLKPAREYREYYLYWEGVDSPNNIALLQFGIEE